MAVNTLQPSQQTGFLEGDNRNSFTSDKKVKFLELAQEFVNREEYPDVNGICRLIGIDTRTFQRHLDQDERFADEYENITCQIEQILSRALIQNAKKANGVGAAAFWLKNRVSKRWSDNPTGNQIIVDLSSIKNGLTNKQTIYDADIVE